MVSKRALNEIIKDYLTEQGFSMSEKDELIRMFNNDIRKITKSSEEEFKESEEDEVDDEEPKVKPRHGTTCIGLITKDEKEMLFDL